MHMWSRTVVSALHSRATFLLRLQSKFLSIQEITASTIFTLHTASSTYKMVSTPEHADSIIFRETSHQHV